jgi:hypothetical protein
MLVRQSAKRLDIILGLNQDPSGAVAKIVEAAGKWNYAAKGPTNGRECFSLSSQAPLNPEVHPTIFIKKKVDNRTISVVSRTELPSTVHCIITAAFPGITVLPS